MIVVFSLFLLYDLNRIVRGGESRSFADADSFIEAGVQDSPVVIHLGAVGIDAGVLRALAAQGVSLVASAVGVLVPMQRWRFSNSRFAPLTRV